MFAYSSSLLQLFRVGIKPDYFSFIDPYTIFLYSKIIDSGFLKDKTKLLICDLYSDDMKLFNEYKMTTSTFKNKYKKEFEEFKSLQFYNMFFETTAHKPIETKSTILQDATRDDWTKEFRHYNATWHDSWATGTHRRKGYNTDKFAYHLLPLILYHFPNLKEIHSMGFGDFDVSRYTNTDVINISGYERYKQSLEPMLPTLNENLKRKNISIKFIHENYYSNLIR